MAQVDLACLLDFDNTLFDNDGLKVDLNARLHGLLGDARTERFWQLYEASRHAEGTVDFPATVARLRPEIGDALAEQVWSLIWDYPFTERLFPESLAVLTHLWEIGATVGVVSDGDPIYQPHKIQASGVTAAVHGNVQTYIHKQQHLPEVLAGFPAQRYVLIDDKATILADVKRLYPDIFTTLHVRQGHYAADPASPPPDITVDRIGDLLTFSLAQLTHPQGT